MPQLTQTEQNALMSALGNSFGQCTCRTVNGAVMACEGHRFLAETQRFGTEKLVDRVTVLTYYRRMASLWTDGEFSRPFTTLQPEPMLEPDPLPPDLIPDPHRLPW